MSGITITVCAHVPDLRGRFVLPLIEAVLARYSDKDGFRIVHYSVHTTGSTAESPTPARHGTGSRRPPERRLGVRARRD